jgi:hypothetical protein
MRLGMDRSTWQHSEFDPVFSWQLSMAQCGTQRRVRNAHPRVHARDRCHQSLWADRLGLRQRQ